MIMMPIHVVHKPTGLNQRALWLVTSLVMVQMKLTLQDTMVNVDAPREYCKMERFNATCQADEVVIMQSARYGRMNFGRCVKGNYGFLGCAVDVLGYLDNKCSGSHTCRFSVPDIEIFKTKPCPEDFSSYLEASYRCLRVASAEPSRCHKRQPLVLRGASGYIASKITEETGLGSRECPWIVQVDPGQRVNVTLLNFARSYKMPSSGSQSVMSDVCFDVLQITESTSDRVVVNLCGRDQRENKIYLSKTNKIKVEFLDRGVLQSIGNFLIKYEAISCPDIRPPPDAWVQRQGDTLMIKCNSTQETWYLTCRHDNWVGELGNCSDYKWSLAHVILDEETFPYGVLVVVAIGVVLGVVLGGVLLAGLHVFVFSKRNKRRQEMCVYQDNKENMRILDSNNSNNGAVGATTEWTHGSQYTDWQSHERPRDHTEHHVLQADDNLHRGPLGPHVCDVIPPNESFSTFRPKPHLYESPSVT